MSSEIPKSVFAVDSGFPFIIKEVSSLGWINGEPYNTEIEAEYYRHLKTAKYYKNKAKHISKKTRRWKKEVAKFHKLACHHKEFAKNVLNDNVEYFV